jgi:hypothetical protein
MNTDKNTELESIKQLLRLLLVKLGATSEEIGAALHMHPGSARKLLPGRKIKKFDFFQKEVS